MAALYDRYAGLFLHTNAAFLCERAHAEAPLVADARGTGACYLRQGAAHRACDAARPDAGRTGGTCSPWPVASTKRIQRPRRLCSGSSSASGRPERIAQLLRSKASPVPHGAAGLYVLGVSARRAIERTRRAYYVALEKTP